MTEDVRQAIETIKQYLASLCETETITNARLLNLESLVKDLDRRISHIEDRTVHAELMLGDKRDFYGNVK